MSIGGEAEGLGGFVKYSYEKITTKVEKRRGVSDHEGGVGEAGLKPFNTFNAFGKPRSAR